MTEIVTDSLLSTHDGSLPEADTGKPADIPDEWGVQSFPASDPPQNW